MKKVVRKIIVYLMIVCCLISGNLVGVHRVKAAETEDYKTFSQLDSRWANKTVPGTSYTLGQAGCFITSISILMAYANPELRDVSSFNPYIASQGFTFINGGLNSNSVSNVDSTFTKYKDVDGNFSAEEALNIVKKYYEEGYYIIIQCTNPPVAAASYSSHFSPVVGFEDGKPVVWDVAGGLNSDWDTWASTGIKNIDIFASTKNKSYDVMSGDNNVEESAPQTEEEIAKIKSLIKEYDLAGMPKNFSFTADTKDIELPDRDGMTQSEIANLESIKLNIDERHSSWFDVARRVVTFIGLAVIVYGVLLGVAYLFDKSNNILEISLLGVLTLGRYKIWNEYLGVPDGYKSSEGTMYCGGRTLFSRIVVIEIVGFFLVGNGIFEVIYRLLIRFVGG